MHLIMCFWVFRYYGVHSYYVQFNSMTLYNCGELVIQHTYKSKFFAYQIFKTGAPVIEKLPVVMKCQVEYISEAKGFICMIVVT